MPSPKRHVRAARPRRGRPSGGRAGSARRAPLRARRVVALRRPPAGVDGGGERARAAAIFESSSVGVRSGWFSTAEPHLVRARLPARSASASPAKPAPIVAPSASAISHARRTFTGSIQGAYVATRCRAARAPTAPLDVLVGRPGGLQVRAPDVDRIEAESLDVREHRVEALDEGRERRERLLRRAVAVGPVVDRVAGLAGDEVRRHERDRVRHRAGGYGLGGAASGASVRVGPCAASSSPPSSRRCWRPRAAVRATTSPPRPSGQPSGLPSLIAYTSPHGPLPTANATPASLPDIYLVTPQGKAAGRVTTTLAWELDPAWSPDGTRIAFARGDQPERGAGSFRAPARRRSGSRTPTAPTPSS